MIYRGSSVYSIEIRKEKREEGRSDQDQSTVLAPRDALSSPKEERTQYVRYVHTIRRIHLQYSTRQQHPTRDHGISQSQPSQRITVHKILFSPLQLSCITSLVVEILEKIPSSLSIHFSPSALCSPLLCPPHPPPQFPS